uniref:SITS-binding protein n=1 Tax=Tetronarce californica TaxID=7787 RepID=SP15_TETCF|nr:RecName: Full=SITS-binding protein; AltName: Full=SP105 [Tetronarce californica]CAA34209.1 4-acetamido-4'-isothiocyanostilbene-2, 2'-disulphonic acid-binding protein [Tetronarce californica]
MARRAKKMASNSGDSSPEPGIKEINETWKGAIACLGVALLFLMTIGVLYWQVVEKPDTNWVLRGQVSGLVWDKKSLSFSFKSLSQDKTFARIDARHLPVRGGALLNNHCWFNTTRFCHTWDGVANLQVTLDTPNQSVAECYRVEWTPLNCQVALQDCFSMVNTSWYGGGSMRLQYWPINNANINSQPFVISDLQDTPTGYGSVLERYFLGSTGVAVRVHQEVPLHVGIESRKQLCLGIPPNAEMQPLRYTICVSDSLRSAHQQFGTVIPVVQPDQPDTSILRLPHWRSQRVADIALKLEHNLKTFTRKLKLHRLGEGIMDLGEQSTLLLSNEVDETLQSQNRYRGLRQLRLSITLSPFTSIDSHHFQTTLQEGRENLWLGLPSAANGSQGPLLMKWKGKFAVKLNISNEEAQDWFIEQVHSLQRRLEVDYVNLEVGVGSPYVGQAQHHSCRLCGDDYINQFALLAEKLGNGTTVSAATRTAHLPVFVRMVPRQSDWSHAGLKGLIPSILHYSLLGYSFFIPDVIGGSLTDGFLADEELFVRWMQIATFLPVMSFSTPPWVFGETWIVNVTRSCIHRHQTFVVPLLMKYAAEWTSLGHPVFRPLWWVSPSDPNTFTINDEFLIGDEVLVAPVTESGKVHRDIYLPGNSFQWKDMNTAQVFEGGTLLREYPVALTEVAVFIRQKSKYTPAIAEIQQATT